MNLHFFLICIAVLGCYAAIRTVKRGWVKTVIVMLLVVGIVQLSFDTMFPHGTNVSGDQDFFTDKMVQLESDRCMMSHMKNSPLSSLAYVLEMHRFLREMKDLQAPAMRSQNNMGTFTAYVNDAFGDQPLPVSPGTAAIADTNQSMCEKFNRWLDIEARFKGDTPQAPQGLAPAIPAAPGIVTNTPAIVPGVAEGGGDD